MVNRKHVLGFTILVLIFGFMINAAAIQNGSAPILIKGPTAAPLDTGANISLSVNQSDAHIRIQYGTSYSELYNKVWDNRTGPNRVIELTGLSPGTLYYYSVFAYNNTNQSFRSNSTIKNFTTKYSGPSLIQAFPSTPITITAGQSINLTVTIGSQGGLLSWYINDDPIPVKEQNVAPGGSAKYTFKKNIKGTYNITANLSNENGSDTARFTILNRPATYSTGSRIWDGDRYPDDFSTTYSWTPQSFSGFYYAPQDGVGSESIEIELTGRSNRTIGKNNIIYSTEPQEVYFNHNGWGKYQVIGFMADKYFAGYTDNTISAPTDSFGEISVMAQGQLHKVLYDDNTRRKISVGGTLALKDGYVLKVTDIDLSGRTMFLRLLKDGEEVDSNMLRSGETYVYKNRAGYVDDLPLILVRLENVSTNQEFTGAFIKGIFQISDNITNVRTGNKFGTMEVVMVSKDQIVMKNNETGVNLTRGSKVDLMGDLKIIMADNDNLRFALSVERKGNVRVRSAVFDENINRINEWTPYNFGMNIGRKVVGFYYDLDNGLGNERLSMIDRDGRSIPENSLVYTTQPGEILFNHDEWGRYQVIGFMANKYFAGYKGHDNSSMIDSFDDISAMAQGQLHKILIDDDKKHTILVGDTFTLKDGYVLKATYIDLNGRTMFLVLSKDGKEVDSSVLKAGETYVYKKRAGSVDELPLILVRFDSVFAGQELQAAFMKGIFQIAETATEVKNGDRFDKMEVMQVNDEQIVMKNSDDITLYRNRNNKLMGNIRLKVADSDILRFYFAVDKKIGLS